MCAPAVGASIARVFSRWPERIALELGNHSLTYAELGARCELWCGWLQHHGVTIGRRVAIDLCGARECIECMIACARIGAVYVPIDPGVPLARKQSMMAAADIDILVCDDGSASTTVLHANRCGPLPAHWQRRWSQPYPTLSADDPLAIMFTSGSTGTPKGVIFPQGGVVPLVTGPDPYLPLTMMDRVLQVSARSFDAFVWEMWGALLNGACLVLLPPHWSLAELGEVITTGRISAAFFTARLFDTLIDTMPCALAGMRLIGFGGEAGSARHVAKALDLLPGVQLVNGYGPSENTTFSLGWHVHGPIDPEAPLPIGRPCGGDVAWLLDPETLHVIGGAGQGELFVGGPGLALGYTDAKLTAEKFGLVRAAGCRLFRTGDLVRRDEDGVLRYLGRLDRQVKILGARFNLFELEADIVRYPAVTWAHAEYDVLYGRRELAVFYTTTSRAAIAENDLKDHLARGEMKQAPAMLFFHVERVPLKRNGKLDVPALIGSVRAARARSTPEDPVEQLWASFLPGVEITPETDFFEAGGDSLAALNLLLETEQRLGIKLPADFLIHFRRFAPFKNAVCSDPVAKPALVTLQSGAGRTAVVLVPWLDGSPYNFLHLLPHLPPSLRVFSIDFRAMREERQMGSLAQIGARLLDDLVAMDFSAISLIGPSLAGVVGLDLAAGLEARGMLVNSVVLLDSFLPNTIVRIRLKAQLRQIVSFAYWAAQIRSLLRGKANAGPSKSISFSVLRPKLRKGFSPRVPVSGRIVLLQATEQNDVSDDHRKLGRRHLLRRIPRLETRSIAGAHLTLLDKEHSPALAKILLELVRP